MKRWSVLVTAVLSFSILAGCAGGGEGTYLFDRLAPASGGMPGEPEPRSLILTHSSPAGSLTDQAAQLLKEKVEEASEGQLQIQIYPEDSLGNLDDGRWYFENGAVDMRIGAGPSDVSSIATWLPTLTGCTPDEVSQALRPGQPLWDLICQQAGDTLVLGVLPSSSRVLTSSRPVEDLSQLDGLMVRVIPSSSLDRRFWEALGAQTVEIPIQDLYLALQQGLADAQENPIYLVRSYNFHQQQKYLIPINFKVYLETIYLNLEVCRSLTEEQQALLRQAAEDTCREMVEVTARYLEECQDIFQREGMEVRPVSEEERARAWEKVCPLVEEYLLSLYGADVYQQVLDALSAAAKDLASRAKGNKLTPDEYKGSTFSVSNLGMFGIETFTPIVNQPDAAILGVCAVQDELVMDDEGNISKHQVMRLSFTYDHRLIDGAVAAKFVMALRDLLEKPMIIIL